MVKNWILVVLGLIAAVLDSCFDLIKEALDAFGAGPKWVIVVRIVGAATLLILAKLQPPSLEKAKDAAEGYHPKK